MSGERVSPGARITKTFESLEDLPQGLRLVLAAGLPIVELHLTSAMALALARVIEREAEVTALAETAARMLRDAVTRQANMVSTLAELEAVLRPRCGAAAVTILDERD